MFSRYIRFCIEQPGSERHRPQCVINPEKLRLGFGQNYALRFGRVIRSKSNFFDAGYALLLLSSSSTDSRVNFKPCHGHDVCTAEAVLWVLAAKGLVTGVRRSDRGRGRYREVIAASVRRDNANNDHYERKKYNEFAPGCHAIQMQGYLTIRKPVYRAIGQEQDRPGPSFSKT